MDISRKSKIKLVVTLAKLLDAQIAAISMWHHVVTSRQTRKREDEIMAAVVLLINHRLKILTAALLSPWGFEYYQANLSKSPNSKFGLIALVRGWRKNRPELSRLYDKRK